MDGESGEMTHTIRRCGRIRNRQVGDRKTGMRLKERTRELIPAARSIWRRELRYLLDGR